MGAQQQVEVGGVERALARLVDDELAVDRRDLGHDLPARLAPDEDAPARAGVADAGADALRPPELVRRAVATGRGGGPRGCGSRAARRSRPRRAPCAVGLEAGPGEVEVVAHRVDVAAGAAEVDLPVDADRGRCARGRGSGRRARGRATASDAAVGSVSGFGHGGLLVVGSGAGRAASRAERTIAVSANGAEDAAGHGGPCRARARARCGVDGGAARRTSEQALVAAVVGRPQGASGRRLSRPPAGRAAGRSRPAARRIWSSGVPWNAVARPGATTSWSQPERAATLRVGAAVPPATGCAAAAGGPRRPRSPRTAGTAAPARRRASTSPDRRRRPGRQRSSRHERRAPARVRVGGRRRTATGTGVAPATAGTGSLASVVSSSGACRRRP